MRTSLVSLALSMAILLMAASAAYPQYGGGGDPFTIRSSTMQEGVRRGAADLLRSQGLAAKMNSEATVAVAEAIGQMQQQAIENRKAALEAYYDFRRRAKELRMAKRSRRLDAETRARLAQNRRPDRLSHSELDPFTGRVHWPVLLRYEAFADARARIERLFEYRACLESLSATEYLSVRELTETMRAELKDHIRQLPPSDYMRAKQFLEGIAYEAAQPAGPLPGLAMQP